MFGKSSSQKFQKFTLRKSCGFDDPKKKTTFQISSMQRHDNKACLGRMREDTVAPNLTNFAKTEILKHTKNSLRAQCWQARSHGYTGRVARTFITMDCPGDTGTSCPKSLSESK